MPKIPEWGEPKGNLTTEPLAPQVNANVAGQAAGATDAAIGTSLDAVVKTGEHFLKLYDDNQEIQAKNAAAQQLMQIQADALNDPDPFTAGARMQVKMATVGQEAAKGIANAQVRNKFLGEYDLDATRTYFSTNTHLLTKQVKVAQANRLEYYDKLNTQYASADPASQQIIMDQFNTQVNTDVRDQLWTPEQGKSFKKSYREDMIKGVVDYDISRETATSVNNSYVLNELKAGAEGKYAMLNNEERAKYTKDTEAKIARNLRLNNFNQGVAQDKNERKMLVEAWNGNLNQSQLDSMALSGGITTSAAKSLKKLMYSDKINPTTDMATYNEARKMQADPNVTPQQLTNYLMENSEKISDADRKDLLNNTFENKPLSDKNLILAATQGLSEWANQKLEPGKADDVVYDFYTKLSKTDVKDFQIQGLAYAVKRQKIMEIYPNTATMEDVPNFVASLNKTSQVYDRKSKLKGKKLVPKPVNVVVENAYPANFDDPAFQ